MDTIQYESLLARASSRSFSAEAAPCPAVGRDLREGGRLRWLHRLASRWAAAVAPLRLGAAVDPGLVSRAAGADR